MTRLSRLRIVIAMIVSTLTMLTSSVSAGIKLKPTKLEGLEYKGKLLNGKYDTRIEKPESILGFPIGQRTATPEQIVQLIKTWEKSSNKIKLVEYARSHENRPLYYAIISTPETLAKLGEIKQDLNRLANPLNLSSNQEKEIIERLPAVSWMAYSIHGNESSGADSALAAIYHLIASQEKDTSDLLSKSLVIIDPLMNPDGRARFTKTLEENRGVAPNIDDQSLLHSGVWPYGRTNHYLFDLNRDFILGVHPETIGRVKAINEWHPQLMIDGHEMGPQSSYLFAPAREPINKNLSSYSKKWGTRFANDQAASFDKENWPYYTGEWFENLYPGYSSYAEFRGSIHILYEQASIDEDGIRQNNGRIVTYKEAVHHQLTSTIANLTTLAENSKEIYRDFVKDKRHLISSSSQYANQSFAILPSKNKKRLNDFVSLMQLQGFELHKTTKAMTFSNATNQLGEEIKAELPEGTIIIRNRQSQARLIAAILEFDAKILDDVLIEERQKVLRNGSSLMYDTTAWNLTMMHGVKALTIPSFINSNIKEYSFEPTKKSLIEKENAIAYVVDGADDSSVGFAARLMEQGVQVRILDKATVLDSIELSRGTIVVSKYDNEPFTGDLNILVETTAKEMKVTSTAITKGLGKGDLPDIGGAHFKILKQPRLAILTGSGINSYDYGAIWHSIDSNLGIRHSHLENSTFSYNDLRRYNTIVVPDRRYGSMNNRELKTLKTWVEAGGTLIVIDGSISDFTNPENKFSSVRQLSDSFKEIEQYDLALQSEWLSQRDQYSQVTDAWSHNAAEEIDYPWNSKAKPANPKKLKKQYQWLSKFSPSGAIVAARTDQKHWLTFGTPEMIPVLISRNPILMTKGRTQSAVRLGYYKEMNKSVWQQLVASFKDKPVDRKVGWSTLPDEYELKMRMSGLLWPEASKRIANSSFLTRERIGNGQVIMFAAQPIFRGSTKATNRLLLNAIVYGAGLGTRQPIKDL